MSYNYHYCKQIDLFVEGKISKADAARQTRTAKKIINKLQDKPGIVLADEVGMGKTFVALAAAVSVHLSDPEKRPVVVMVPSSLSEKWPRDFNVFLEKCVPLEIRSKLNYGVARRAVEFLKFLDDPVERRKSIIFLTHGAMSRGLNDGWVKFALIQRALYRRRGTEPLKKAIYRYAGKLLYMLWAEKIDSSVWQVLLNSKPRTWLKKLQDLGIDPENDGKVETDDDPIPEAILEVMDGFDYSNVYQAIQNIPRRDSKYIEQNLKNARQIINHEIRKIWRECLLNYKVKLPLLIMDEAHHLKNSHTNLASLFRAEEAEADANEISKGSLAGIFQRMLFLTATPFQLGHYELCSVLDRFNGIDWGAFNDPQSARSGYAKFLESLRSKLDKAQESTMRLEKEWGRLKPSDLILPGNGNCCSDEWWEVVSSKIPSEDNRVNYLLARYDDSKAKMKEAEKLLRKAIIRHIKPEKLIGYSDVSRRHRIIGKAIIDSNTDKMESGIELSGPSLLPFLLAARSAIKNSGSRPVFAEGLASSYEAFLKTRKEGAIKQIDMDGTLENIGLCETDDWYLDQLEQAIKRARSNKIESNHPKLDATVEKAINLWLSGEKVLIFCHYIATGKALRYYISDAMLKVIKTKASEKLRCDEREVMEKLEQLGDRFSKDDSSLRIRLDEELEILLKGYSKLEEHSDLIKGVVLRYIRTPSFLLRYFPIQQKRFSDDTIIKAFDNQDSSGLSLRKMIVNFLEFLDSKCGEDERSKYLDALKGMQSGQILTTSVDDYYTADEIQGEEKEKLLPNVRLVNGTTKSETRQKLMLTFNTPFYPDIMVASSVMAEGVDLHMNCRHVIHHDLCWNPSTLEQRTGRVDRIGAKAENCGKPIQVYIPFIAETQDEKMFRVVMDRERWFKVVMGEKFKIDVKTTDKIADRVPLPRTIGEELAFKLEV